MASLPVDILADPGTAHADGLISSSHREVVRPERVRRGGPVVAGWGERAWRTQLRTEGVNLAVGPPPEAHEMTQSVSPTAWRSRAQQILEDHWARGTDEATRARVIDALLELPTRDLRRESRSLRVLLGSHRALRRAARRVLLQSVAQHHLEAHAAPHTLPTWQVLARFTRTPAAALAGQTSRGVLLHDLHPQCPTARRWSDG